ncbi:Putative RNA polymerase sigma-24 subunit, ECF subfamily protein [Corynebacterium glyciniphilum AJ 3170]|uniref:Putative RNA polymerase sigma-24 subunit, ECF subfamily protein n=2 Tax=Corynebacterium TaxID=1716 RepID=X5DQL9_9CORY|nr:Putative RNA polymerase sigma-24 subunit, ECF subfamily protein [Corynebacterium glyciniphilum AJ 3170]
MREETMNTENPDTDRGVLLGLSYRLLGSLTDAEDAVQETYVRWYRMSARQRQEVRSPRAWLIKTAGRIGLDMLTSARARRETYVGEWLPEPVPGDVPWNGMSGHAGGEDPAVQLVQAESVSMALMVVLETMTPAERVVFILHDVFGFTFPEVAEVVDRSPAACRQLATSARRRVRRERVRSPGTANAEEHSRIVRSFRRAWSSGDVAGLVQILDPAVTAVTDGGGVVSASTAPLRGAQDAAQFFVGALTRQPGLVIVEDQVNGQPGLVASHEGRVVAVVSLLVDGGRVVEAWAVRNPEKLVAWNQRK